jgi:DNA-binding HxlR family transcriptional regulator
MKTESTQIKSTKTKISRDKFLDHTNCTVFNAVDLISKKWGLLIIFSIYKSEKAKKRYNQIKKDLSEITPKILSLRLKELEKDNIIIKETITDTTPIKTYYSLTESGIELIKIIQNLKKWGLKWNIYNEECDKTYCKHCNI